MSDRDRDIDTHQHANGRVMLAAGLAAAIAAMVQPGAARAAVHSDTGWVQLETSASDSASTTIAGKDFAIGYTADLSVEAYNWDVAPNTITVSCVSLTIDTGLITITLPVTTCPILPGIKLSQTTVKTETTVGGWPAIRNTTTVVWDVPDSGALLIASGFLDVPATLFSHDLDLLKLTGKAVGNTDGADTIRGSISVLGSQIAQATVALPVSAAKLVRKCLTLVDVDAQFAVVGIPVDFSASSTGCLEVDASAAFNARTLQGTLTPDADVDATGSAAIGGDGGWVSAEAGVSGTITVVDARVPLSFNATVGTTAITLGESARLTMTGLDGHLDLFAQGCLFGLCVGGSLEIFDWTGLTYVDATIFNASQTLPY